jgi:hypothetical protein
MNILGLQIVISPLAYEVVVTDRRLFPASRHRSKRIEKKLIKRFGGIWATEQKPLAYKAGDRLIVHPTIYEELKRRAQDQGRHDGTRPFSPGLRYGGSGLF